MKNLHDIAKRLNALSEDKQQQFRELLQQKGIDSWALPIVPTVRTSTTEGDVHIASERLPLSSAQQRLWFIDRYEQGSSLYNLSSALQLKGRLDARKLQQVFSIILERHEVLRTHYGEQDGCGYQIIPHWQTQDATDLSGSEHLFPLDVESLPDTALYQQDFGQWLEQLYAQEQGRSFDLSRDLPFRARLIRVAEQEHILVLTVHHIAFDAWSQEAIIRELSILYACALEQNTSVDNLRKALPPLPIQYKDYALWEKQWLAGEAYVKQLAYWQTQLADMPECLTLPLDKPRRNRSEQRHLGREVRLPLGRELSELLYVRAKANNVTVYQYLLSIFNLILHHYSGSTDLAVGSSVANRQRPELESLAGLFVNTLVLRTQLSSHMRFTDLLQRVSEISQQAVSHQDIPFDHLLDALDVVRSDTHTPLFQVLFVYLNIPDRQDVQLGSLSVEPLACRTQHARFDVTLRVEEQGSEGLCLCMEYDTDLFFSTTIEQILGDYKALCASLCNEQNETKKLVDIGLASAKRGQETLTYPDLLSAEGSQPQYTNALAMFLAHVDADEHANALYIDKPDGEAFSLSYRALDQSSRRGALALRAHGIKAGDRVGLCLERGEVLISAIFACWRLGAAYVALDPQWPSSRLNALLQENNIALVLAEDSIHTENTLSYTAWCEALQRVDIDSNLPNIDLHPQLPAYYIFTSGSTGKPKAVSVSHANLVAYVQGVAHDIFSPLALAPHGDMASLGTLAADLGHTAVFGALLTGRCLRLISKEISDDPSLLAHTLRNRPLHCLKITPSHLKGFTEVWHDILPTDLLILGGEAFDSALFTTLQASLIEQASSCRLVNHYGPTETCVGVIGHALAADEQLETFSQTVPLGRALPQARTYILDDDLNPVPPGVTGELYIAGPCVTQGYHGLSAMSAERFLPDPYSTSGERMYRSGDRVRLTARHTIEYIGRSDHQVKIRGYRVELGEIEQRLQAIIAEQSEFQDAIIVFAHQSMNKTEAQPAQMRLHAFLSADNAETMSHAVKHTEAQMMAVLPEYMLPSTYTVLPVLPRLGNGKVDRRALTAQLQDHVSQTDGSPIVGAQAAQSLDVSDEPSTESEKILADIWCQVLGREQVGVHDNFFTIGGDSILSLQVLSRAKKQGIKFKPKQFFDGKTIAGILALIEVSTASKVNNPEPIKNQHSSSAHVDHNTTTQNNEQQNDDRIPQQPRQNTEQHWPLSYSQERLWWLYQYDSNSTHYNLPIFLQAKGLLDIAVVEASMNALVARHEVLRSRFVDNDGQGAQMIEQDCRIPVPLIDLSGEPEQTQQANVNSHMAKELAHVFDLQRAPLLKLSVLRLSREHHVLLFNMHHICTDGWSIKLLINGFSEYYSVFQKQAEQGETGLSLQESKPLAIQYADFAYWQRKQLGSEYMAELKHFWLQHLRATEAVLDLPTDKPRPAQQSYKGARFSLEWPEKLDTLIQSASQQSGKTAFMLMMAAFQYCLHRYSGQDTFRIGYPVNGRSHSDTQDLIGFFVNTMVLPVRIRDHLSVDAFLNQVQEDILTTQTHQDMPFEHLVQLLETERDLSRSPLFQVMLNFQHAATAQEHIEFAGLSLCPIHREANSAKFDLSLDITEHRQADGTHYSAEFEYCTELFEPESIQRIATLFTQSLAAMLEAPDRQLRALSVVPKHKNTDVQHQTCTQGQCDKALSTESFLASFERHQKQHANQSALIDAQGSVSYAELGAQVNHLAHWLKSKGVGAEDVVGINLPRTRFLLISLLAVQKVGAAYVPLDPQHPLDRRVYMLMQSKAKLVLDDASIESCVEIKPLAEACPQCDVIDIHTAVNEAKRFELEANDETECQENTAPQQLTYTIYTSGSTGKPKGVQVTRSALDNLLRSFQAELNLKPGERCLALTTVSFDISALELYLPLMSGACVVLADEQQRIDPDALMGLIHQHDIGMMQATPATWRMLLSGASHAWPDRSEPIKALCGGEALPSALAQALLEKPLSLMNVYGPTETTIWSTTYTLGHGAANVKGVKTAGGNSATNVAIGLPVANTQLYLLDQNLSPVPTGAQGTLYIGGEGLARGYSGRPDLTAHVFVPNPFADDGSRLYNTGDRARINVDGNLEYLGRDDGQIKLHGYRIELPEIEACLSAVSLKGENKSDDNDQGRIESVTVVVHQEQLVAYWVGDAACVTNAEARMREALVSHLPEYMRPRYFVHLDQLPLSAAGKVDRKTLASKALVLDELLSDRSGQRAASNALEACLVAQWQSILALEDVGVQDNFFALGGHSLLATQLVARAKRDRYIVEQGLARFLTLRMLFNYPTAAALAEYLQSQADAQLELGIQLELGAQTDVRTFELPDLHAFDSHLSTADPAPLSFQQQRLWLIDQMENGSAAYNMPLAARLSGDLDLQAVQQSIDTIMARHDVLRTHLVTVEEAGELHARQVLVPLDAAADDGPANKSLSKKANTTFSIIEKNTETLAQQLRDLAAEPFDLATEAPLRVHIIPVSTKEHYLQLTIHHIASDAWSMYLLLKEFVECYRAYTESRSPELPKLALQYSDYARWQRQFLAGEALAQHRSYWAQKLSGSTGILPLVLDNARSEHTSYDGAAHHFMIDSEPFEKLQTLAQASGASVFMVLMSAYCLLLHKETETQDVLVGTDVANRHHPELETLIGFFINVLPIRSDISHKQSFLDYLQSMKETLFSAFEHQHLPFEQIVEALNVPRIKGVNPLVQTLFVMQNTPSEVTHLPGLDIEPLTNEQPSSRFDLALFVEQKATNLQCKWVWRRDLFSETTIKRLAQSWQRLLVQIADDATQMLEHYSLRDTTNESGMKNLRTQKKLSKLKGIKKKGAAAKPVEWVKYASLPESGGKDMPLVITPSMDELDPLHWAEQNRKQIETQLEKYGALLFRGFKLKSATDFEDFVRAIYPDLYGNYGDLPKEKSGKKIYKSTPYPDNQMILYHNESSHMHQWPRRQWFFSEIVAQEGGATPIVDCREVYRHLPASMVENFERKGLLYVRNFTERLDVSWQDFFKTDSRQEVEQRCRDMHIECEWLGENALQTRERAPAVIQHPITGEKSFFNQVQLHHVACLEAQVRKDLETMVGLEGMPRNVYYGDGTPIDDAVITKIIEVYETLAIRANWQQGDVFMLDNMLVAHARDPFSGPRKIAVAMADMQQRKDFYIHQPVLETL